ncbi:MAG: phosphate ABC transporter permease PstA [Spirochaetes bacterium]|nr:phosphate ABC transporter permease PstA [Spirochaetota bacterium]
MSDLMRTQKSLSQTNLRKKRKAVDGFLYGLMIAASVTVAVALVGIIVYILYQSAGMLNIDTVFGTAGDNFLPMIVSTFLTVLVSLTLALPIGIMTAIYLNEYARKSGPSRYLGLAVDTLAGIPSIVYGLFGLLLFVRILGLGQSIIAGGLTLSIMILPVIIRTTEEALKTVPNSFREGSLSLGATKFQTIRYAVLPPALPGMLTAAILAAGRVVGESAPVLLTVGIARHLPRSIFEPGRTLTIHLYHLTKEAINPDDFALAFTAAAVLIILILIINTAVKLIGASLGQTGENVD